MRSGKINKKLNKVIIKNKTFSTKGKKAKVIADNAANNKGVVSPTRRGTYNYGSAFGYENPYPGKHVHKIDRKGGKLDKKWMSQRKVVVFAHFYYNDLISEVCDYMDLLPCPFNLWVSLPDSNLSQPSPLTLKKRKQIMKRYPTAQIRIVPNRGKDIGGKLQLLNEYLKNKNSNEDWMIFCHDKKSPHMSEAKAQLWRKDLLTSIFGNLNVNRILSTFKNTTNVKMCGGRVREGVIDSRSIAVNQGNTHYIKEMAPTFGMRRLPHTGAFIGGTMFWADGNFYRQVFRQLNIENILKLLEKGNVKEPSRTHAIERFFGLLVTTANYKIGSL